MRSLDVPAAEPCFNRLANATDWTRLDSECRQQQRSMLIDNQNNCCAWCEQSVELESSHIDHIESRSQAPQRIFDVSNIVASCGRNSGQHCGHYRTGASLPVEVNVYMVPGLQCNFRVAPDGELVVIGDDKLTDSQVARFEHAIKAELNLNCSILKQKRQRRLAHLYNLLQGKTPVDELMEIFPDFPSLTEQVTARVG